jgi:hypothetical protein
MARSHCSVRLAERSGSSFDEESHFGHGHNYTVRTEPKPQLAQPDFNRFVNGCKHELRPANALTGLKLTWVL